MAATIGCALCLWCAMYETRKLHLISDEEEGKPCSELVIEVGDTHAWFTFEVMGHDGQHIKIPVSEIKQTVERLSSFLLSEYERVQRDAEAQ